jgi:hypothetical protein
MGLFDNYFKKIVSKQIDEEIKAFQGKSVVQDLGEAATGEGIEDVFSLGYGSFGLGGFNRFYNRYINKPYETEYSKIMEYRKMADSPEIADVIEDAANEATEEDDEGQVLNLQITDHKLSKNENIKKTLIKEFSILFHDRIGMNDKIWDWYKTFLVDGRIFYERVIDLKNISNGIVTIKKLPAETMDFVYDPKTLQIQAFYQYLGTNMKRPLTIEDAKKDHNIIVFIPEQIGFCNYGLYGRTRQEIFGYLEKSKVPYNQLKLIETAIIIFRIVRSPERLVFKIDTGNMPKDKAMKFVEKIKNRFIKKQTYDPTTGRMSAEPEVLSILENFFIPTSPDGRGSDITSVGGNPAGFTELADLYYFQKKLYRAIKYPMSRVVAAEEGREGEVVFGGSRASEISRDEIKWAKFLERQQRIMCREFRDLFLMHLNFRGLVKEYNLDRSKISVLMQTPSHYKQSMEQAFLEQTFSNYNALQANAEFSKSYLIKKYLKWTEDELEENLAGFKADVKLFPKLAAEEGGGEFIGDNPPKGELTAGGEGGASDEDLGAEKERGKKLDARLAELGEE